MFFNNRNRSPSLYKKIVNRVFNKTKFYLESFILGGTKNHLLLIAATIASISLLSGLIHYLIYPGGLSFPEAVWWGFLRLTDPGYLGDDTGLARRIISTVVTVLGYVLFLGSLIAIMIQWLNRTMRNLEMGLTPITLNGHVLILGWTNRTPIIIRELILSDDRLQRFLRKLRKRQLRIVVLKEEVDAQLVHDLKEELGNLWDPKDIIFRSGLPLRIEHLLRVDFQNAGVIIVPGSDFAYGGPEAIDTRIMKILMTVTHSAESEKLRSPDCVTEIQDLQKIPVLKNSYHGSVEIIASNLIISRLVAQNARHRGIAMLYTELLNNEGNEIYVEYFAELTGAPFSSLRHKFSGCVVLGYLRKNQGRYECVLCPAADDPIMEDDLIIFLAERFRNIKPASARDDTEYRPQKVIYKDEIIIRKKILIIGWNSTVPSLINEFGSYENDAFEIDIFSVIPVEERNRQFEIQGIDKDKTMVNHITGNSTVFSDFKKIDLKKYDTVVMLANDWLPSSEESDARTIMGYMFLQTAMRNLPVRPHFIIELMEPDNEVILRDQNTEILITPYIISYAMSQIAIRRIIRIIFDQLFTAGGAEIFFRDPGFYELNNNELPFSGLENHVFEYGDIVMGIQKGVNNTNAVGSIILNPEKNSRWSLDNTCRIIVLHSDKKAGNK